MTTQSEMWGSAFGDAYHERNQQVFHPLWYEVLDGIAHNVRSVFEPGAGQGDNLAAIRGVVCDHYTNCRVAGQDVNEAACKAMEARNIVAVHGPFPDTPIDNKYELVVTRGFLIHLPFVVLNAALDKIYDMSTNYICLAEYYSPKRRAVNYHGQRNALWCDDFAGRMMDRHLDLKLLKYGFKYGREGGYDLTYFLMSKR